jgi:hypothetical protein
MITQCNNFFVSEAIDERGLLAHSFAAYARPITDRDPSTGLRDHGIVLPEAGDSMA